MSRLEVRLEEGRSEFRPGAEVKGTAHWNLDAPARRLDLRLCWFTRGLGITEARVIETITVDRPQPDGSQAFRFRLPEAPQSYIGALSSLFWAIELVALPTQECAHAAFAVSAFGHPFLLAPAPGPQDEETEEDEEFEDAETDDEQ